MILAESANPPATRAHQPSFGAPRAVRKARIRIDSAQRIWIDQFRCTDHPGAVLKAISERVRERRLGSDARAGRRVRDEIRRTQWDFVRRNAWYFATGLALGGLATAAAAWLAPNDFLSGSAVGAGTVFTIGGLAFTVMMLTGTGSWAMGAVGEAWTSQELRPLRRHGWKHLDHVYFRYGDVDHVLVGPSGVVVVESKWSAEPWALEKPNSRISDAVRQVQRNSRDLRLAVPELRHRDGSVRPVLFLWGGARSGEARPAGPVRIDDVDAVVGAAAAKAWRDQLGSASVLFDASDIQAIWARLRNQAVRTDERESRESPPPSLTRLYWTGFASFVAAVTGVLAVSYTISWTGTTWSGYVAAGVAVVIGAAARRITPLRYPALGWLAGILLVTIALIAMQLTR